MADIKESEFTISEFNSLLGQNPELLRLLEKNRLLKAQAEEAERVEGGGKVTSERVSLEKTQAAKRQAETQALPLFQRPGFSEDPREAHEIEATGIETPQEITKRRQTEFKIAEKSKKERVAIETQGLDLEEQIRQLTAQAETITTTAAEKYVEAARTYEKTFGGGAGRDSTPLKLIKMRKQIGVWRNKGFHEQADALEAQMKQISQIYESTPKPWEIRRKLESQSKRASEDLMAQAEYFKKKLILLRGEQATPAIPGIDFPVAVQDEQVQQQVVTPEIATQILQEAGGDKVRAREIASQRGLSF